MIIGRLGRKIKAKEREGQTLSEFVAGYGFANRIELAFMGDYVGLLETICNLSLGVNLPEFTVNFVAFL